MQEETRDRSSKKENPNFMMNWKKCIANKVGWFQRTPDRTSSAEHQRRWSVNT